MLKSALGILDKETKIEFMCWKVMKSGSQLVKSLQIVVSNIKLLILVTLTSVLRALVNKTLLFITQSTKVSNLRSIHVIIAYKSFETLGS